MKKNADRGYEKTKPISKQKSEDRIQKTDDGDDSKISFNKGL